MLMCVSDIPAHHMEREEKPPAMGGGLLPLREAPALGCLGLFSPGREERRCGGECSVWVGVLCRSTLAELGPPCSDEPLLWMVQGSKDI